MLGSKATVKTMQVLLLLGLLFSDTVRASVVSVTKDVDQTDSDTEVMNFHGEDQNVDDFTRHLRQYHHHRRLGRIRYHFDDNSLLSASPHHSCSHVVVVGVGTSMTVDQYDKIAAQIVTGTSIVMVVANHNVHGIVKTSATQYARLLNEAHDRLKEILDPICSSQIGAEQNIIIGGHSSSGQAAFEAMQQSLFDFQPLAFLGLDPFAISPSTLHTHQPLSLPALYWGLTETTCFVQVQEAALGAYRLTTPSTGGKVLYSIDNQKDKSITHCVFTDHGCGMGAIVVCPTTAEADWVHEAVARSLHLFLDALEEAHTFDRKLFELPQTNSGQLLLHVNEEVGPLKVRDGDTQWLRAS